MKIYIVNGVVRAEAQTLNDVEKLIGLKNEQVKMPKVSLRHKKTCEVCGKKVLHIAQHLSNKHAPGDVVTIIPINKK